MPTKKLWPYGPILIILTFCFKLEHAKSYCQGKFHTKHIWAVVKELVQKKIP